MTTRQAPDPSRTAAMGPVRGTALYVSAVLGPGILTLPALAAHKAGPAFLIALSALLALSVPLALTYAALGQRGIRGGLPAHVREAFGPRAGSVVTALFYLGVPPGVGALGLFGGGYLAQATGRQHTALAVAIALVLLTWTLNTTGLRASATVQVVLTGLLLVVIVVTVAAAAPHVDAARFDPVAPHGWTSLLPATFLLVWVLTGWEASANLSDSLRPGQLRRVTLTAVAIIAAAFIALSVVIVGTLGTESLGAAPVADLARIGLGSSAMSVTVALALVLTLGNMNAYVASLGAIGRTIPAARRIPGGPLGIPSLIALAGLALTAGDTHAAEVLVAVTAASQVPVLALAAAAGLRLLPRGAPRTTAAIATAATAALVIPAGWYLIAPVTLTIGVLLLTRHRSGPTTKPRKKMNTCAA
jgi:amino acid efflux transporter